MKTSCSFFKKKFNIPASVSMVPRVIGLTTRVPKIPVSAISILFVPSNAVLIKKKCSGTKGKEIVSIIVTVLARSIISRSFTS